MKKYETYKTTGIDWIGEIPEHWDITRLKYTANKASCCFIDGDWIESTDISQDGIRYITTGNIGVLKYKEQGDSYISEETFKRLNCTEVFEGDIIISRLNEPIGRSCILPNLKCRVVTSVDNVILRPDIDTYNKQFLVYWLNSKRFTENANLIARGATMHRISRNMLGHLSVVVPPLSEQEAIAKYLDEKCSSVDKVIATQEKRVALLNELKQSVISEAVTRGINPNVPLKESGVEWIGQIPEHWEVMPFKRCMKICNGADYKHIEVEDGGFPVIGSGGTFAQASEYMYDGEVLLLGRKGTVDKPLYFKGKFWTVDTMFYSIPRKNTFCKYMYYQSLNFPFERYSTATALPSMTSRDLMSNFICLPPFYEQREIVAYIDKKTAPIDALISKANKEIDLLKEYKQTIISETVTGKIKVC